MDKPYPEYVDLSLFNFPDHIDPKILLNLEIGKPVKLEEGLHVRREEFISSYKAERLYFFLTLNTNDNIRHTMKDTIHHNPYGPDVWSNGSLAYYNMGKLHRIGGPATMIFYASGEVELGLYLNGEYFANELDYWIKVEELKNDHSCKSV